MSKKIKILKNSFFVNAACSHSGPDDYFTVKFRIVREGNIYGDVQILIHSTIGRPKSVLPPVLFKSIVDPGFLNTFLGNNLRPPASKKKHAVNTVWNSILVYQRFGPKRELVKNSYNFPIDKYI